MYRSRGFGLPGSIGGASAYLAQHDFVHVLADYGTNLNGELEVFALIGRADPDPKGFAWLATLVGLFETGYVADAGFFSGDLEERRLESPEMHLRIADAIRRGRNLCDRIGADLLDVDYHEFVDSPIAEVRAELGIDPQRRRGVVGRITRRVPARRDVAPPAGVRDIPRPRRSPTMRFAQGIRVRCDDPDALMRLLAEWDEGQASTDVMGYIGTRLLADRDEPDRFMILAEFAEVDGDLTPAEEAERNDQREESERWAQKLRALVEGEPDWTNYDELYWTGITGNLRTG